MPTIQQAIQEAIQETIKSLSLTLQDQINILQHYKSNKPRQPDVEAVLLTDQFISELRKNLPELSDDTKFNKFSTPGRFLNSTLYTEMQKAVKINVRKTLVRQIHKDKTILTDPPLPGTFSRSDIQDIKITDDGSIQVITTLLLDSAEGLVDRETYNLQLDPMSNQFKSQQTEEAVKQAATQAAKTAAAKEAAAATKIQNVWLGEKAEVVSLYEDPKAIISQVTKANIKNRIGQLERAIKLAEKLIEKPDSTPSTQQSSTQPKIFAQVNQRDVNQLTMEQQKKITQTRIDQLNQTLAILESHSFNIASKANMADSSEGDLSAAPADPVLMYGSLQSLQETAALDIYLIQRTIGKQKTKIQDMIKEIMEEENYTPKKAEQLENLLKAINESKSPTEINKLVKPLSTTSRGREGAFLTKNETLLFSSYVSNLETLSALQHLKTSIPSGQKFSDNPTPLKADGLIDTINATTQGLGLEGTADVRAKINTLSAAISNFNVLRNDSHTDFIDPDCVNSSQWITEKTSLIAAQIGSIPDYRVKESLQAELEYLKTLSDNISKYQSGRESFKSNLQNALDGIKEKIENADETQRQFLTACMNVLNKGTMDQSQIDTMLSGADALDDTFKALRINVLKSYYSRETALELYSQCFKDDQRDTFKRAQRAIFMQSFRRDNEENLSKLGISSETPADDITAIKAKGDSIQTMSKTVDEKQKKLRGIAEDIQLVIDNAAMQLHVDVIGVGELRPLFEFDTTIDTLNNELDSYIKQITEPSNPMDDTLRTTELKKANTQTKQTLEDGIKNCSEKDAGALFKNFGYNERLLEMALFPEEILRMSTERSKGREGLLENALRRKANIGTSRHLVDEFFEKVKKSCIDSAALSKTLTTPPDTPQKIEYEDFHKKYSNALEKLADIQKQKQEDIRRVIFNDRTGVTDPIKLEQIDSAHRAYRKLNVSTGSLSSDQIQRKMATSNDPDERALSNILGCPMVINGSLVYPENVEQSIYDELNAAKSKFNHALALTQDTGAQWAQDMAPLQAPEAPTSMVGTVFVSADTTKSLLGLLASYQSSKTGMPDDISKLQKKVESLKKKLDSSAAKLAEKYKEIDTQGLQYANEAEGSIKTDSREKYAGEKVLNPTTVQKELQALDSELNKIRTAYIAAKSQLDAQITTRAKAAENLDNLKGQLKSQINATLSKEDMKKYYEFLMRSNPSESENSKHLAGVLMEKIGVQDSQKTRLLEDYLRTEKVFDYQSKLTPALRKSLSTNQSLRDFFLKKDSLSKIFREGKAQETLYSYHGITSGDNHKFDVMEKFRALEEAMSERGTDARTKMKQLRGRARNLAGMQSSEDYNPQDDLTALKKILKEYNLADLPFLEAHIDKAITATKGEGVTRESRQAILKRLNTDMRKASSYPAARQSLINEKMLELKNAMHARDNEKRTKLARNRDSLRTAAKGLERKLVSSSPQWLQRRRHYSGSTSGGPTPQSPQDIVEGIKTESLLTDELKFYWAINLIDAAIKDCKGGIGPRKSRFDIANSLNAEIETLCNPPENSQTPNS